MSMAGRMLRVAGEAQGQEDQKLAGSRVTALQSPCRRNRHRMSSRQNSHRLPLPSGRRTHRLRSHTARLSTSAGPIPIVSQSPIASPSPIASQNRNASQRPIASTTTMAETGRRTAQSPLNTPGPNPPQGASNRAAWATMFRPS